jgi:hypothetical protein
MSTPHPIGMAAVRPTRSSPSWPAVDGEHPEHDQTDDGMTRHAEHLPEEGRSHGGEQPEHREPGEGGERPPAEGLAALGRDVEPLGAQPGAPPDVDRLGHRPDSDHRRDEQGEIDPEREPHRRPDPRLGQESGEQRPRPEAAHVGHRGHERGPVAPVGGSQVDEGGGRRPGEDPGREA